MADIAHRASSRNASKRSYDALQEDILKATVEVLEERGSINLTVAEVAKRARTTTGALYSHFQDREGLLRAAYLRRIPRPEEQVASVAQFGAAVFSTSEDRDERVLEMQVKLLSRQARIERLATIEALTAAQHSQILMASMRERAQEVRANITEHVRASQSAGLTRADLDPEAITAIWVGCILGSTLTISVSPELQDGPPVTHLLRAWDAMIHQFDVNYVQKPETIERLRQHLESVLNDAWKRKHLTMQPPGTKK
jgi:TetR/AcrR family transcriptional regulator, transcriptional repressor of aconitase